MTLRARTVRVDDDIDPLLAADDGVVWLHDGAALAGRGIACRVDIPAHRRSDAAALVHAALHAMDVDDELGRRGSGPLAFAALPFALDVGASFVVPALSVGRDRDGERWVTWVGEGPAPDDHALRASVLAWVSDAGAPGASPRRFDIEAARDADDWCASVATVRDRIRDGEARKVVMAREIVVQADRPIPRRRVLQRLHAAYPTCYVFALPTLVGASPELLVSRRGDVVRAQPMAGTARRSPDPQTDARLAAALFASEKDRVEHQITIDMVHDTLLPWCSYLDARAEPEVVSVANVHHLATEVQGRLSRPSPSVLDLVAALHPTPAVCGEPRDAALRLIAAHEQMDRGAYAGAVGWVDRDGNGEFAVGVRSAEIVGDRARLFAGGGVVAHSDPMSELEESRVKFETMLGAIVRP